MAEYKKRKMDEEPAHGELIVIGAEGKTGEIPERMVIRAEGLFYRPDEEENFKKKSLARCPTCGNCSVCYAAGPVGKKCEGCGGEYKVVFVHEEDMDHRKRRIVDAESLADLLGHHGIKEKAMIDRKYSWIRTPSLVMRRSHVTRLVTKRHQDEINEEVNAITDKLFH